MKKICNGKNSNCPTICIHREPHECNDSELRCGYTGSDKEFELVKCEPVLTVINTEIEVEDE